MKKLFLSVLSFIFVFSTYLSPVNASYSGKMSFLLGEDYDDVKSNYTHDPNAQYFFKVDNKGYDYIACAYRDYDTSIFEILSFNDDRMSIRYTISKFFNNYDELVEDVKDNDRILHEKGNVEYFNGVASVKTWEYLYVYRVKDYQVMFIKEYTPRGEYKASLDLIDRKFDRIQRGYY